MKDLEIREAMNLIKLKVEKENEEKVIKDEGENLIENDNIGYYNNLEEKAMDGSPEDFYDGNEATSNKNIKTFYNDKEWNPYTKNANSDLNNEDEKLKAKVAEDILKNNKVIIFYNIFYRN